MKKKEIETLDKINEGKKITKKVKEKIIKGVSKNFLLAVGILIFFIILMLVQRNLTQKTTILIYKILSSVLLCITILLFEIAYKKDSGKFAVTSIEMLILSIITLVTPLTFSSKTNIYIFSMGVFFAIYYAIKNYFIYKKEKNVYLKEKNDISEIVKKESQDKFAKEQVDKIDKQIPPKRKRGRPRKNKIEE